MRNQFLLYIVCLHVSTFMHGVTHIKVYFTGSFTEKSLKNIGNN
jgi:hypothetical protein